MKPAPEAYLSAAIPANMMKSPPGTTMNTADESNIFLHSKVQERVDDPHYVHKEISNVSTPRKEFFSTPNRECQQSALPDVSQKSGRDKEQQQLHKGRGSQSQNTFQVSTCSADISCGSKSDIIPTAENDRDDDVQPVNKRPKPVFQYSGLGEGLTKAEEVCFKKLFFTVIFTTKKKTGGGGRG